MSGEVLKETNNAITVPKWFAGTVVTVLVAACPWAWSMNKMLTEVTVEFKSMREFHQREMGAMRELHKMSVERIKRLEDRAMKEQK